MTSTNEREMGIELSGLNNDLESHEYPASSDELIEMCGDHELELTRGSETVRELLEPVGDGSYESAEEVRQAIYNMVGSEAVGRENYSDRGLVIDNTKGESDEQSL